MVKSPSSPVVTKLLYISKEKTKSSSTDTSNYLSYVGRMAGQKIRDIINRSDVFNEDELIKEVVDSMNLKYGETISYEAVKTEINNSKFESEFIKTIDERVSERLNGLGDKTINFDNIVKEEVYIHSTETNRDPYLGLAAYNDYIGQRYGSYGLFSDRNIDIDAIKQDLKNHSHTVYCPIISFKEKDAELVGLKTEDDFRKCARKYIDEFAKTLKIDRSEIKWVCAFHEKTEDMINKEKDAGKQPHLHFMIWSPATIARRFEMLNKTELTRLRQKAASVFMADYLKEAYSVENKLKSSLKENAQFFYNETEYQNRLLQIKLSINKALNGKGRLTKQTIDNTKQILIQIIKNLNTGIPLSTNQESFLKKLDVGSNLFEVQNRLALINEIDINLSTVVEKIVEETSVKDIYALWLQEKADISRLWAGKDEIQAELKNVVAGLKRELYNGLLKNSGSLIDTVELNDELSGVLLDKISTCKFKSTLEPEEVYMHAKTVIDLLISIGDTSDDILSTLRELMSDLSSSISYEKISAMIYSARMESDKTKYVVSLHEFYTTLKSLKLENSKDYYPYYVRPKNTIGPSIKSMVNKYILADRKQTLERKDPQEYSSLVEQRRKQNQQKE